MYEFECILQVLPQEERRKACYRIIQLFSEVENGEVEISPGPLARLVELRRIVIRYEMYIRELFGVTNTSINPSYQDLPPTY